MFDFFIRQNKNVTDYMISKTRRLKKQIEASPNGANYSMFNDGGVEIEVGEFLCAFIKMIKPKNILETGTHLGVSSMYMAQALKENNCGHIETIEINPDFINQSKRLWSDVGVQSYITTIKEESLKFVCTKNYDVLFLDSEPQYRFDELVRFYDFLNPGGFIFIHDLHPHLGLDGPYLNGMECWPYGDFRPKFGDLIKDFSLQTFTFRTPRGFTIFQKSDKDFGHTKHLQSMKNKLLKSEK